MHANPVSFTGTGALSVGPQDVVGMAYTGFTSVVVYDGTDNTGQVVLVGAGAGSYALGYELTCDVSVYIQCAGSGSGTLWIA